MDRRSELIDLERGDAYGRSFGDVYDLWYEGVTDAEATADFVAARDPIGPVLELGVGTGRLAEPLADRGRAVVGLDASAPMLDRCPTGRAHPHQGPIHRVRADMRALPFSSRSAGGFGSALIGFNTLFNLVEASDQEGLLRQLTGLVRPGGPVVVEMLDVAPLLAGPDRAIGRRDDSTDPIVVTATTIDRADQRLHGTHVELADDGVAVRPWLIRWVTPDQLDTMAARAGLTIDERYGSWDGAPAGADAATVISVYRVR